jgi:hypothetical protein
VILELVLLMGLAAAGLVAIARALAPTLWLIHKPLSCDLCMSWWSSLIVYGMWHAKEPQPIHLALLAIPASVAVSLVVTKAAIRLSA